MTLPASQYSVLDAKRIERIDDATFRCYVGGISFLNFKVGRSAGWWISAAQMHVAHHFMLL